MKKKRFLIACFSIAIGVCVTSITTSVAWIIKNNVIIVNDDSGIDGSMFTGYFHCGSGSEDDPFVITRPIHWSNLVWLHNNVDGFYNANGKTGADKGYYFQVGYDLDDDGTYKVYEYDDDGKPVFDGEDVKTTTTLNLSCYDDDNPLIPLGSPQFAFIGELDGKNIEISGFAITSIDKYNKNAALEDIGIFGYVGPNGYCHDVYFSHYTIDTDGSAFNEDDTYQYHVTHQPTTADPKRFANKEKSVCVGMLAGHINYAKSFKNVYINNCTIDRPQELGTHKSEKQLVNYGYYGYVEYMESGQSSQVGDNYKFRLDSQAVFDYFDENYANIRNLPLRARYAEVDKQSYTEYSKEDIEKPEYDSKGNPKNGFTKGVAYVTSGLNSYNLQGLSAESTYTGKHNYSLSTLGYQPIKSGSTVIDYKVYADNGSGQYNVTPAADTDWTNTKNYETLVNEYNHHDDHYGYFDNGKNEWEYYSIKTEQEPAPVTVNLTFKIVGTYRVGTFTTAYSNPDLWSSYSRCYLFIDNIRYELTAFNNSELSISAKDEWKGITHYRYMDVTCNITRTYSISLRPGTHYLAFSCTGSTGNNNGRSFAIGYSTGFSDWSGSGDDGKITVGQHEFVIDKPSTSGTSLSKTFECDNFNCYSTVGSRRIKDKVNGDGKTYVQPPVDSSGSYRLSLRGMDENGGLHPLNTSEYEFTYVPQSTERRRVYDDDGNPVYDDDGNPVYEDVVIPAYWNAHFNTPVEVDYDADTVYIADDPNDTTIKDSGYSWQNIDIVGGGIRFSDAIPLLGIPGFITVDGETDGGLVKEPKQEDMGTPFYATKYCPSSIVMYLKNIGGVTDSDIMGTVTFDYALTLANTGLELKSMIFKKGYRGTGSDYNFIDFEDVKAFPGAADGDFTSKSIGTLQHEVTMIIRRGALKRVSYVALDKNRNIIASYSADGTVKYHTTNFKDTDIATYVICLGVHNHRLGGFGSIINTRITKIDFEFIAAEGFGGNFGPVEFRTTPVTVTDNYFTFYFYCLGDDKYQVTINYISTSDTTGYYCMHFKFHSDSRESIQVNLFLTDFTNFKVYLNPADDDNPQASEIACQNSQAIIQVPSTNF